jgi:hypothetical protein
LSEKEELPRSTPISASTILRDSLLIVERG